MSGKERLIKILLLLFLLYKHFTGHFSPTSLEAKTKSQLEETG